MIYRQVKARRKETETGRKDEDDDEWMVIIKIIYW